MAANLILAGLFILMFLEVVGFFLAMVSTKSWFEIGITGLVYGIAIGFTGWITFSIAVEIF